MKVLSGVSGTVQGVLLAVVIVGCATGAVITGHITGTDYLAVLAAVGGFGGTVTTAHVVGTQVNTAAASSQAAPAPVPPPPSGGAGMPAA